MSKNEFRDKFRYHLRGSRYNQKQLAHELNVDASTVSKWVNSPETWPRDALTRTCELFELNEMEKNDLFTLAGITAPPEIVTPHEPVSPASTVQESVRRALIPVEVFTVVPWWGWFSVMLITLCVTVGGVVFFVVEMILDQPFEDLPLERPGEFTTGTETAETGEFIIPMGSPAVQRRINSQFLWRAVWSPDGSHIALDRTTDHPLGRSVSLYDADTLEEVSEILRGSYAPRANGLAFSHDGQMLIVGNTPEIRVYYGDDYSQSRVLTPRDKSAGIGRILFRANDKLMFANNSGVTAWDTTDWREIFHTNQDGLYDVTADGQTVAVVSGDLIEIWDVESEQKTNSFISQHIMPIDNIEFMGPDKLLMSVASDKLSIWDIETGEEMTRIEGRGETRSRKDFNAYFEATQTDFSPHVRFVILQDEKAGQLIGLGVQDKKTKKLITVVYGTYNRFHAYDRLVVSSDGTKLLGTTEDQSFRQNSALHVWRIGN